MLKRPDFGEYEHKGWPTPQELKPYFFAPPGKEWFNTGANNTGGLDARGVYGSARVDARLEFYGIPGWACC